MGDRNGRKWLDVRNPKSKNDFVGVWARQKHLFVLKKIFSRNPTPLIL